MTKRFLWLMMLAMLIAVVSVSAYFDKPYSMVDYPGRNTAFPSHGTSPYVNYMSMKYGVYGGGNYQHYYKTNGAQMGYGQRNYGYASGYSTPAVALSRASQTRQQYANQYMNYANKYKTRQAYFYQYAW